VLVDLHLGDGSGIAIMRVLKSHNSTHDIPLLAVTAYPGGIRAGDLGAEGFAGVIPKPLEAELFVGQVAAHFQRAS